MPFASYSDLKDEVASWLNRKNLTAQIPSFIALAEADIASRLRDRRMTRTVIAATDCGSIALPDDFVEAQRVSMVGARTPLRYLPLSEMNIDRTEGFLPPRFYSLRGGTLDVAPVPPANPGGSFPEVELVYYARPVPLSDAAPRNWLLEQEPETYLYAALVKAAPFMVDDERIAIWAGLYNDNIERLNLSSKVALVSGGVLVRGRRGFG
jgi:hypothetical protein